MLAAMAKGPDPVRPDPIAKVEDPDPIENRPDPVHWFNTVFFFFSSSWMTLLGN